MRPPTSSFTVRRVNKTTFVVEERDRFDEHPLIYAKIHPVAPVIILSDTGCDAPADAFENADFVHLRSFLEHYPVAENNGKPINPNGERTYIIILTHCHYDHIGGITQFLAGGQTEILASAAGRDFVESDLAAHSLCNHVDIPVPQYKVTHWAQSCEKLTWPLAKHLPGDVEHDTNLKPIELEIDIIHTPGHTPDELAWVDRQERTIYVGDSFYELGGGAMPIVFPPQGNIIEWNYSLAKIADHILWQLGPVDDSTADDGEWALIAAPWRISAAHQTVNQNAFGIFRTLNDFFTGIFDGTRPALYSAYRYGEVYSYWCSDFDGEGPQHGMAMWCPERLMNDFRSFYANMPKQRLAFDAQTLRAFERV